MVPLLLRCSGWAHVDGTKAGKPLTRVPASRSRPPREGERIRWQPRPAGSFRPRRAPHSTNAGYNGKDAAALGLSGTVDSATFQVVLEDRVLDGPHLGKRAEDGAIWDRPGRDVLLPVPELGLPDGDGWQRQM